MNKGMVINRENINKILIEVKPTKDTNNTDDSFHVFSPLQKLLEG